MHKIIAETMYVKGVAWYLIMQQYTPEFMPSNQSKLIER
jgi:hypothetical protein